MIETADYLKMLRRMIRAAGKRVGHADPADLRLLAELRVDLDDALQTGVDGLRADGFTWASIGEAMGTTRQAALMRWGRGEGRWSPDGPRSSSSAPR